MTMTITEMIKTLITSQNITGAVKIVDRDSVSSINVESGNIEVFGSTAGVYACYQWLKSCHYETNHKLNVSRNLKNEMKKGGLEWKK